MWTLGASQQAGIDRVAEPALYCLQYSGELGTHWGQLPMKVSVSATTKLNHALPDQSKSHSFLTSQTARHLRLFHFHCPTQYYATTKFAQVVRAFYLNQRRSQRSDMNSQRAKDENFQSTCTRRLRDGSNTNSTVAICCSGPPHKRVSANSTPHFRPLDHGARLPVGHWELSRYFVTGDCGRWYNRRATNGKSQTTLGHRLQQRGEGVFFGEIAAGQSLTTIHRISPRHSCRWLIAQFRRAERWRQT